MNDLTSKQAYLAMYAFLDARYQRTKTDDVRALLGSMSFLPDGVPVDPAIAEDWRAAVQAAVTGAVDAHLRLAK